MAGPMRLTRKVRPYAVKPPPLRVSTRAWKAGALLDAVRTEVMAIRDAHEARRADYAGTYHGTAFVRAETLATRLRAKKSMVTTAFQRLIEEGLIGHKSGPLKWDQRSHNAEARPDANFHRKYREFWYPSMYVVLTPKAG